MKVRGIAGAVLLAAATFMAAGPALAHAELESSTPRDGQELGAAPQSISFTFGEELMAEGNAVTARAVGGEKVALGPLELESDTVTAAWPTDTPAGQYRASYRVVSADGHPIDGSITFSIAAGASPSAVAASPAAAASASPLQSAVPIDATVSPEPTGSEATGGMGLLGSILVFGVVVLAAAAAGRWFMVRARRP